MKCRHLFTQLRSIRPPPGEQASFNLFPKHSHNDADPRLEKDLQRFPFPHKSHKQPRFPLHSLEPCGASLLPHSIKYP